MAAIDTYLQQIRTAVYGRDVRSAIANGIEVCYDYVTAFEGLDLSDLATKAELDDYLSKTEASQTYVTSSALEGYAVLSELDNIYATKVELSDYITEAIADGRYATKTQLGDYLTSTQLNNIYLKKQDALSTYITYSDLQSYITESDANARFMSITDASNFVTYTDLNQSYITESESEQRYVHYTDIENMHSFDVVICGNSPIEIPRGATHKDGAEGSLIPTAATMYKIYMVPCSSSVSDIQYEKYITVQTGAETFAWERFANSSGGSESGGGESGGGSGSNIDLSEYLKTVDAEDMFEPKGSFESYLEKADADLTYVKISDLNDTLANYYNSLDPVTHGDLINYVTREAADSMYASSELLRNSYTDTESLYRDYATKAYVDSFVVTFPNNSPDDGTKNLLMLEIDDIPGTTQSIAYKANGDVDRIIHKRNNENVRVDSFTFNDTTITEVRTLSTGESLTMVTNTETSVTTTTYRDSST